MAQEKIIVRHSEITITEPFTLSEPNMQSIRFCNLGNLSLAVVNGRVLRQYEKLDFVNGFPCEDKTMYRIEFISLPTSKPTDVVTNKLNVIITKIAEK